MTEQRDPARTRERLSSTLRRDDGGWGMVPILAILAVVLGLGYYGYHRMNEPGQTPRATTTENASPGATTPPATTPTTPKQP